MAHVMVSTAPTSPN